ncbi:MAG: indole-3-glycerol-phosphate synthase [Acidimicrobiales bacterium]|nr:indole-3-glycerol-phosphate synthase [Acidimicrobiales bacterium]MXX41755.1 indole-3-glycerol-phosphate synthase [Acidimicrobiales bacterium]MYB80409.1 indole-3-glycerol-phosphate synthase [Acidimicrobiales bacterium]MYI08714.1 indole-3-glycerol-phosphate synthase [Acidimicrobiales bacterium]MYI11385.1 indole-3-glycerol-phosphate synthase [Acidimicrobiales bacterium]
MAAGTADVDKDEPDGVPGGHRFAAALRGEGLAVIAEIKRRSPSRGALKADADAAGLASEYKAGGAACLSVLTESERFSGSPEDLQAAKAVTGLPVLRKDFLRTLDDVRDSHEMGADAMLVILADIDHSNLLPMQELALSLGVDVLTEVRDEAEFEAAVELGAYMIAVNQRDNPESTKFTVDYDKAVRVSRCFEGIDDRILLVAASGIGVPGGTSMRAIAEAGYDAALIGEALVVADDPPELLRDLLADAAMDTTIR